MRHELLHVFGRAHREVVADARADRDLLHALHGARAPIQLDEWCVVRAEGFTHVRKHAGGFAAGALDLAALARESVHVCGRAAEVADLPGEARRLIAHALDLADHRILGTVLDDAALVLGDRAERAAAEAAA